MWIGEVDMSASLSGGREQGTSSSLGMEGNNYGYTA
jgi:hypothetical protein